MAPLTATQKMHLANVKRAKLSLVEAEKFSAAAAKAFVADQIAGHRSALAYEVRLAFDSGIRKAVLRREGLGTSDSKTLEDILAKTAAAAADLADVLERDPLAFRYAWDVDASAVNVTLTGSNLVEMLSEFDLNSSETAAARDGIDKASFEVKSRVDGSRYVFSLTPALIGDTFGTHPVVGWMRDPINEAELIEWFDAHEKLAQ